MKRILPTIIAFLGVAVLQTSAAKRPRQAQDRPNFVIIATDDQGYGDLGCYGGDHVSTPRIDQMGAEGARLTSFYVAASVCTPSRAALTTDCYPKRIDMARGSNFGVLLAGDRKGLNPGKIPTDRVIDGKAIWPTLIGEAETPH